MRLTFALRNGSRAKRFSAQSVVLTFRNTGKYGT
jgi:hypothetical protein